MGTCRHHYKIVIPLFAALLATPSLGAESAILSPLKLNARYNVAWSGITLGRINITADEDDTTYSLVADTKTRGIGVVLSDERTTALASGSKTGPETYIPVRYESRPQAGSDARTTVLTYDAQGKIASRSRSNDDDPAWRPVVPNDQINTAHDPITAAFMLRRAIHDAIAENKHEVETKTYDGARLATMKFTRAADARVEVMGAYVNTINLVVTRTPITGYTPKELKKFNKGDPEIHLYFTDDDRFMPVRATAATPLGALSMTLVSNESK